MKINNKLDSKSIDCLSCLETPDWQHSFCFSEFANTSTEKRTENMKLIKYVNESKKKFNKGNKEKQNNSDLQEIKDISKPERKNKTSKETHKNSMNESNQILNLKNTHNQCFFQLDNFQDHNIHLPNSQSFA